MILDAQCAAPYKHEEHNWYYQSEDGVEVVHCPGRK